MIRLRSLVNILLLAGLALLGPACSADPLAAPFSTPTLFLITSTLPPTLTPRPSPTPAPPTATQPVTPVEGQTTSQLNVRSAPSATSDIVGTVYMFSKVQIVGKDAGGNWWFIQFPESPTGAGWITAQYVQVSGAPEVPVINEQPQPAGAGPAPTAATSLPGAQATAISDAGAPTSPPAPSPQATASPVALAPALVDNDSAQSPAARLTLSEAQMRTFNYSSDVSSPQGDPEDWVIFTLAGQTGQPVTVSVTLDCTGNADMSLELIQNSLNLQRWEAIPCGQTSQLILNLYAGSPYSLRLLPGPATNVLVYAAYTLIVSLQ